jgi:hypothetical protein
VTSHSIGIARRPTDGLDHRIASPGINVETGNPCARGGRHPAARRLIRVRRRDQHGYPPDPG